MKTCVFRLYELCLFTETLQESAEEPATANVSIDGGTRFVRQSNERSLILGFHFNKKSGMCAVVVWRASVQCLVCSERPTFSSKKRVNGWYTI